MIGETVHNIEEKKAIDRKFVAPMQVMSVKACSRHASSIDEMSKDQVLDQSFAA